MIYVLSGGTKLFAAIGVTYPAGSAVTCTNGTTTLKAKTTTGQWVFSIPKAGTWTVTASDGTNTKSQSVSITAEGQNVNVELAYWNGEIYDRGNEFVDLTGGWVVGRQNASRGTFTKNESSMYILSSENAGIKVSTVNTIDITEYKTLSLVADSTAHKQGWLGITQNSTAYENSDTLKATANILNGDGLTTTLDISGYTGLWRPVILSNNGRPITVHEVRLIK